MSSSGPPPRAASASAGRTSGSAAAASGVAPSSSTSSQQRNNEDRLGRTWRTMANCLIIAAQKADKAAAALAPEAPPKIDRDSDEYVMQFMRNRMEWGKLLSYLEAKLEGRAQELEAIHHFHRTMPKCSRPSKRPRLEAETAADPSSLPPPPAGST